MGSHYEIGVKYSWQNELAEPVEFTTVSGGKFQSHTPLTLKKFSLQFSLEWVVLKFQQWPLVVEF